MVYNDLPKEWRNRAKKLVLDSVNQWEKEIARDNSRTPNVHTEDSEIYKEQLSVTEFDIIRDEVTKQLELIIV